MGQQGSIAGKRPSGEGTALSCRSCAGRGREGEGRGAATLMLLLLAFTRCLHPTGCRPVLDRTSRPRHLPPEPKLHWSGIPPPRQRVNGSCCGAWVQRATAKRRSASRARLVPCRRLLPAARSAAVLTESSEPQRQARSAAPTSCASTRVRLQLHQHAWAARACACAGACCGRRCQCWHHRAPTEEQHSGHGRGHRHHCHRRPPSSASRRCPGQRP